MSDEEKKIIIDTYKNVSADLKFGADQLKEAGSRSFARQMEKASDGVQTNIAILQGKYKYKEKSIKEYFEALAEWMAAHREDFYHAAELLALGYILGRIF